MAKVTAYFSTTQEMVDAIAAQAKKERIRKAAIIRKAIREYLSRHSDECE